MAEAEATNRYTSDQLAEIEEGRKEGLDTGRYENPKYLAIQMRQIRLGLEEGLDVDFLCNPELDWIQMEEIRKGLKEGVDVSLFASPDRHHTAMHQIRHGLRDGVDVRPYIDYPPAIVEQIRRGLKSGIDLSAYVKAGFDAEQIREIRIALEKKIPIIKYLKIEFRAPSLAEMRIGLEEGLDIAPYAKLEYEWRQMRELRLGLKARVDISKYSDPLYGFRQMREIRLGLEAGIPVDEYRQMRFSATDMKQKRLDIMEKMVRMNNAESADFETIVDLAEIGKEEDSSGIGYRIVLTPDNMEAYLVMDHHKEGLTVDEVLKAVWDAGVRKGILRDEIEKAVSGTYQENTILIACGQNPRPGKDGYYEFFFRTDVNRKPRILEDGSVDYANIEWYDYVKEGSKIAEYHVAEEGADGYDVLGNACPAIRGKEQSLITGTGYRIGEDKRSYYAAFDGMVSLENSTMTVSKFLEIRDVSTSTGNVNFEGSVHIHGDVGFGAVITSGGDVEVDGFVEGASIIAKGNITLRKGMNGAGKGKLRSEKSVSAKFIESAEVHAGENIQVCSALNSILRAENIVEVTQSNGAVVGGLTEGVMGVNLQNVGNRKGTATVVRTGVSPDLIRRSSELFKDIKAVRDELRILGNAKMEMEMKIPKEIRAEQPVYMKIENAIYTKEREEIRLHEELEAIKGRLRVLDTAKVHIAGTVHEGVKVQIGQKVWTSTASLISNFTLAKAQEDGEERVVVYQSN